MTDECLLAPQTAGLPSSVPTGLPTPYLRVVPASRPTVGAHWLLRGNCWALLLPTGLKEKAETFSPPFHTEHPHPRVCARARVCETERSVAPPSCLRAPTSSTGSFTPVTSSEGLHSRPASPWHQSTTRGGSSKLPGSKHSFI